MKALWEAGVPKTADHEMFGAFVSNNQVRDSKDLNRTFYRGIFRFANASYAEVDLSNPAVHPKKYWEPPTLFANTSLSFSEACEEFARLLNVSVTRRLRADTNVGSSLSGGLDSSTIVALIDEINEGKHHQHTFTARFKNFEKDEGNYVDDLCGIYPNINRHNVWPTDETLLEDFQKLVEAQEEPFQSGSIYAQFKVYEAARKENIIVMLDGQGADELLAGYKSFYDTYLRTLFHHNPKKYETELAGFNKIHPNHQKPNWRKNRSTRAKISARVQGILGKNNQYSKTALHESLRYQLFDHGMNWLLRFADRNAMANSIETRLPFLYHELVEFVYSLPPEFLLNDGWTKYILRKSFDQKLCESITWRKDKVGYEPPEKRWLSNRSLQKNIKVGQQMIQDLKFGEESSSDWAKLMIFEYLK